MNACAPLRQLGPNERLLYKVKLEGVKQTNPAKIEELYQQKPNRRFLGTLPFLSVYYFGKKFYNPSKIEQQMVKTQQKYNERIEKAESYRNEDKAERLAERRDAQLEDLRRKLRNGNWLMRTIGEPPAIYDTALTNKTIDQISIYLSSKGYFRNTISYDTTTKGKKVTLNINITENEPFRYSHIDYAIPDTAVLNLLMARERSQLNVGDVYDEELLTRERDRIENVMRNNGYYNFRKQFVEFNVDTSFGGNTVRLETVVANQNSGQPHRAYTIQNIYFITDAGVNRFGVNRDTVLFRGVNFLAYRHQFSPRVLHGKLSISPGQLYSQWRTNRTQRQLTELDVFQSASVSYKPLEDSAANKLNAFINVSPVKRYSTLTQAGLNLTQGMPGPLFSEALRAYNVFGGAEILEVGVQVGLEGQLSPEIEEPVYRTELGGNVSLIIPRIKIPFFYKDYLVPYNPRTRFNAGYTYINSPQYARTNIDLSVYHLWQRSPRLQYSLSLLDMDFIETPRISASFNDYLNRREQEGYPLRQSFQNNLVSSMSLIRLYNGNNISQTLNSHYYRILLEVGGLTRDLYKEKIPLNTFRFFRINHDYRRYIPFGGKRVLVGRVNAGWVRSFLTDDNKGLVPYEKFFFAGGGSSIRAWPPRRLGPGGATPGNSGLSGAEQPGNILLETNVEYRFNIYSYLNGAVFVDAGNVWLDPNTQDTRSDATFSFSNFYNQIAVGAGFGFRFDFEFLIIRFDLANKIIDPARPAGARFIGNKFSPNLNFGIGYPF